MLALLAMWMALPTPAYAAEGFAPGDAIAGRAVALDGDTIRLFRDASAMVDLRLWGIDAPEMTDPSGAGWAARAALDDFLADGAGDRVFCTVIDTDRHGRPVATCKPKNKPVDMGFMVIVNGWAVEYRKFTRPAPAAVEPGLADRYATAEANARREKRGRWALIFGE